MFTEQHDLGLFDDDQYRAAFEAAGLETYFDAEGLDGRGLYIGVKPISQALAPSITQDYPNTTATQY